jgi:GTP pyrophosphokinase
MDIEQSVLQYSERFQVYERFTTKVRGLLEELLRTNEINFSSEHRTKDINHFREKITRPGKSYVNPLNEITDLCGVRIIVRQLADVNKAISIIKNEFKVDDSNSVYKAEELNVDQFGYTSVHLVVNLNVGRAALTEWRQFEGLKIEIQIRTILQHAWAVISHPFDYKVGADIPREFRRRLFRLSALFQLADEELDQLVEDIEEKIADYKASLNKGNAQIELNVDSLRAYMESAREFKYWVDYLRKDLGLPLDKWGDISKTIRITTICKLNTIDDIRRVITSAQSWGAFAASKERLFQFQTSLIVISVQFSKRLNCLRFAFMICATLARRSC